MKRAADRHIEEMWLTKSTADLLPRTLYSKEIHLADKRQYSIGAAPREQLCAARRR